MEIYQAIASALQARSNCSESGNHEWFNKWGDRLEALQALLPSGSGNDCGTVIDSKHEVARETRVAPHFCLHVSYHHMGEDGGYDGWTVHTIRVRPSWDGVSLTITGPNRNDIKDYLSDVYQYALTQDAPDLV